MIDIDKFISDKKINSIYMDVDGVIFASCQAICEMLNLRYGLDSVGSDVTSWNFLEIYNQLQDEDIELLFEDPLFFQLVKPIDGVLDFMNKYRDKIIIVTKARVQNYVLKRQWFDKYGFSDIPIIALPLNVSKSLVNMDKNINEISWFIDDSTTNLNDSNATYKTQFREYNDNKEREWQSNWNGDILYKWS